MKKLWADQAWSDYLYWQDQDRRILRRINSLIKEIDRAGANGHPPAKAEILRHSKKSLRSVRINQEHRLVYGFEEDHLIIVSCKGHYV